MLYVFIASCQLIIGSIAWMISNLVFKGGNLIPVVVLCIGVFFSAVSMYLLGWIF